MLHAILKSRLFKPVLFALGVGAVALVGPHMGGHELGSLGDKDTMVRWASDLTGAGRVATPVTLIDIDNETLVALGGADRAPRDFVAALIGVAAAKKSLGIFVDLDTSRAGPSPEADARLVETVRQYPAGAPVLAYARRFIEATGQELSLAPAPELGLKPLASILDVARAGRANVLAVASVTQRDSDRVVRRWQLALSVCEGKGGETLASPQLVAAAARRDAAAPGALLEPFLAWRTRTFCGKANEAAPLWPRNPDINASIWFLAGADEPAPPMAKGTGAEAPVIQRISARSFVGADGKAVAARAVADHIFAGRFIVIGSSHADSFDTHMTSVGAMPGALIVANAIATAQTTLSARPISPLMRGLVALGIAGVFAALTYKLRAIVAGLVVAVGLLLVLAVLGRLLSPANAIEIVLSAVALLALMAAIETAHELAEGWRLKGWRVVLKPKLTAKTETPEKAT